MNHPIKLASLLACVTVFFTAAVRAEDKLADDPFVSNVDVFGRVMFDYADLSADNADFAIGETELRNARLGLSGKIKGGAKFKVELHTDDSGKVLLTDAYAEFQPHKGLPKLRIGQFKTPNSLDESTSSRFSSVYERAAFTDAFEFNRRLGVAILDKGQRYSYMLGVFGQNIDEDIVGGYALAGRVTYQPPSGVNGVKIHTGASFRYRNLDDDQADFQYRQRPFSHIPGRIIGAGRIADSDVFAGVEAAVVKGRYWLAGEYAWMRADCNLCTANPTFSGGYVEAGLMIHGERDLTEQKFDRPALKKGGVGAASLVFRYDTLELNSEGLNGGAYDAFILGADWWPTAYARLGVNGFIVKADLGDIASGLDAAFADAIGASIAQDTVKGVIFRAQFDFKERIIK